MAAVWLKQKSIGAIRCSSFHRAQQTAQIIGEIRGIEPVTDPDLREMDCGAVDGRTDEAAWAIWRGIFERWRQGDRSATFQGGESYADAYERMTRALFRARGDHNTLVVTHGGNSLTVIPYVCVNAAALQRLDDLSNTGMVVLDPHDAERYVC